MACGKGGRKPRLVLRAGPVQRGSMMSEFPAQPPPTAQSVLWRPAIQELAPPEGDTSLIFIAQRTLAAVEDHLVGALHRPLLGYLVGDTLAAAQRSLPPEHGVVVGWYRSDPTGQHMISPEDHRAHVRHFQRPWQFALVVNIRPAGTRGGFFRPTGDPGSRVVYLPFYELLD